MKQEDQYDEDLIVYKDFSLRKRIKTPASKDPKSQQVTKESLRKQEDDEALKAKHTSLQSLIIDNRNPLSPADWNSFAKIITEVQGLGCLQILPRGQKSSKPYQFNMLHVLPSYKIPCAQLPLDVIISQKQAVLARECEAIQKENNRKATGTKAKPEPFENMNPEQTNFKKLGIIHLQEYQFQHCVVCLEDSEKGEVLNDSFNRACEFLNLHRDQGLSLLVSPKWLFLASLGQPYVWKKSCPVYLDGFAYAGIVDIQVVQSKWPATANLEDDTTYILDAFKKSSEFTEEPEPKEEEKPELAKQPESPQKKSKPATPNK